MTARSITDPDVEILAGISGALEQDYVSPETDPWVGSPFAWVRTRPSRQRGAIGEQLVAGWCAAKGLDVTRSPDSDADRVIEGHRVEIKFSTLWASGVYKFQQIRDQDYDLLFCLGISPFDAHAWVLPKPLLYEHVIGLMGQHTGAGGTETAWLSFPSRACHEWMHPYGGRLREAFAALVDQGRGVHT